MASKSGSLEIASVELLLGEVTRAANHRIAFHWEAVKRKKERKCSFQCENRTAPHSLNKSLSTVRIKFRSETSRAMRTAADAEESVADFPLDEIKVEHVKIKASDVSGRLINALKAGRFVSFFFQVSWRNANSQMDGHQVGRLSSSEWMSAIKTFFARTCSPFLNCESRVAFARTKRVYRCRAPMATDSNLVGVHLSRRVTSRQFVRDSMIKSTIGNGTSSFDTLPRICNELPLPSVTHVLGTSQSLGRC